MKGFRSLIENSNSKDVVIVHHVPSMTAKSGACG